jgi:hypothetical protein
MAEAERYILMLVILIFLIILGLFFGKGFLNRQEKNNTDEKNPNNISNRGSKPSDSPSTTPSTTPSNTTPTTKTPEGLEYIVNFLEDMLKLKRFAENERQRGNRDTAVLSMKFYNKWSNGDITLNNNPVRICEAFEYLENNIGSIKTSLKNKDVDNMELNYNRQKEQPEGELSKLLDDLNHFWSQFAHELN